MRSKRSEKVAHRTHKKKRNDQQARRKVIRRERELKEARHRLAIICAKNARLSRDGFAVTGAEAEAPGDPEVSFWGPSGWYQLATEEGLYNDSTKRKRLWANVPRQEVLNLVGREWRPRQKKSPLWLLAECAP